MQLKARFRREVVEDLLDIKIFSTMNMILKQRLKDLVVELQEVDYNYKLCNFINAKEYEKGLKNFFSF